MLLPSQRFTSTDQDYFAPQKTSACYSVIACDIEEEEVMVSYKDTSILKNAAKNQSPFYYSRICYVCLWLGKVGVILIVFTCPDPHLLC